MSIPTDDKPTGLADADAVAALMGSLKPAKASNASEEEADEDLDEDEEEIDPQDLDEDEEDPEEDLDEDEDDEDEEDEEEEDPDEDDEADASGTPAVADDAVVTVTVDGAEQEFTVGSLKRLAGQEASLTRKSQEADLVGQRAAATIQGAVNLVLEDLAAYADTDWVLEGQRMDPEEFAWHRENYNNLTARRDKLLSGAQGLEKAMGSRRQAAVQQEAQEAVKVLADPEKGIPGWSDDLYTEIMDFAVEAGLPEDDVAQITNPQVIKLINDARMFRKGQKAAAKKVNLTPKRVRKGGGGERPANQQAKQQRAAMKKLASGRASDDDAIQALVGRWGVKGR